MVQTEHVESTRERAWRLWGARARQVQTKGNAEPLATLTTLSLVRSCSSRALQLNAYVLAALSKGIEWSYSLIICAWMQFMNAIRF